MVEAATANDESQLWVMATVAFAVFYSNYMVAPLIPALSHEFSVSPYQLGWLIPGFLIPYGISTLVYGALSDRWGRTPVLVTLLCFATTTMMRSPSRGPGEHSSLRAFYRAWDVGESSPSRLRLSGTAIPMRFRDAPWAECSEPLQRVSHSARPWDPF